MLDLYGGSSQPSAGRGGPTRAVGGAAGGAAGPGRCWRRRWRGLVPTGIGAGGRHGACRFFARRGPRFPAGAWCPPGGSAQVVTVTLNVHCALANPVRDPPSLLPSPLPLLAVAAGVFAAGFAGVEHAEVRLHL